jgi:hypothetical protein
MRVGHARDSCEWSPEHGRAAFCADVYHADAALIVGSRGEWRLCEVCARLPEFKRYRVRRPVRKQAASAAPHGVEREADGRREVGEGDRAAE